MHKYSLTDEVATKWAIGRVCNGLSVTENGNVLAMLRTTMQIEEYTSDGVLIGVLGLDPSLEEPQHCIQLHSGHFLICHGIGKGEHRVCIVDTSGSVVHSYGGDKGCNIGQLNGPCHILVEKNHNVLVADKFNNRVEILSPTLTHIGYVSIPDCQLDGPCTLHLDEPSRCLYVGEWGGGRIFVLHVE